MSVVVLVAPRLTAARAALQRIASPGSRVAAAAGAADVPPLLVIDYFGLAPDLIQGHVADWVESSGIHWADLGDLHRPVRLLDVPSGDDGPHRLLEIVEAIAVVLGIAVDAADWQDLRVWCARVVGRDPGVDHALADIRALLANDDVARWAWPAARPVADAGGKPGGRRRILGILDRALRYPHLAAIAGAPSRDPVRSGVVGAWLEVPRRHLEPVEWSLMVAALHSRAHRALAAGWFVLLLHPPSRLPLLRLLPRPTPPGPPQEEGPAHAGGHLVVCLTHHPSGRPARLLEFVCTGPDRWRLEVLGPIPPQARRAWRRHLGTRSGALAASDRAVAVVGDGDGIRPVPARVLDMAGPPPSPDRLAVIRRRQAAARKLIGHEHLASCFVGESPAADRAPDPYHRLASEPQLLVAWSALVSGGTARTPGVDGVTPGAFGARLHTELETLATELRQERYQPLPPVWLTIPKRDGGTRRIGVTAVRDRVVQRAFLDVAEVHFEARFSARSFGFRPGRGAHHAVLTALGGLRRRFTFAAKVDVKSCFDHLRHDLILQQFARGVESIRLRGLLDRWLRFGTGLADPGQPFAEGVVQGWVLSPFLCNLVLDALDQGLEAREVEFARYADDILLLARSEADARDLVTLAETLLQTELGLRLNPEKTQIQSLGQGADFLGFRIGGRSGLAISPGRHADYLDRFSAQTARLNRLAIPGAEPDRQAMEDEITRQARELDGVTAYFCRLGFTGELEQQIEAILRSIDTARADLPETVRSATSWAKLPNRGALVRRYGWLEQPTAGRAGPGPYARMPTGRPAVPPAEERLAQPPRNVRGAACPADTSPAASDETTPLAERDGSTLHVLRGGATVSADDAMVRLHRRGHPMMEVSTSEIDLIVVQAFGVRFSSQAAWHLSARDIAVICASPAGDDIAVLAAPGGPRPDVRLAQAQRHRSAELGRAAAAMLSAKLSNQASVRRHLARSPRRRLRHGPALREAADASRRCADRVSDADVAGGLLPAMAARLMGYEGKGAAVYWSAIQSVLGPETGFDGRLGRGAADAVNLALNYGYGILYAEVWRAVVRQGLDPALGLIHHSARSRGGLVFDLVEELRAPLVDRLVLGLFGRGWQPGVVARGEGGPALLRPRDRRTLAVAYRKQRSRILRRGRAQVKAGSLVVEQAQAYRDLVMGMRNTYPAFHFRW